MIQQSAKFEIGLRYVNLKAFSIELLFVITRPVEVLAIIPPRAAVTRLDPPGCRKYLQAYPGSSVPKQIASSMDPLGFGQSPTSIKKKTPRDFI